MWFPTRGTSSTSFEALTYTCAIWLLHSSSWCRVRTMCNDEMRISVMVQRTRDEGMLGGLYLEDGEILGTLLYYLPGKADVRVGDTIRTSGIGGFFPKGLYVGTVLSVNREGRGTHDAVVSMDVDFLHLEEALIVVGVDEAIG